MASLGVHGDPGGWENAASIIGSTVGPLTGELEDADAKGGRGLSEHWYGPAYDRYQDAWRQRYQRHGDLIDYAERAAKALYEFGGLLPGFQSQAYNLEQHYLGYGLHLQPDGLGFRLPPGHESLPQALKSILEGLLRESENKIPAMWRDIDDAIGVLSHTANPVIDWLDRTAALPWW